jgi:hypothetical protein
MEHYYVNKNTHTNPRGDHEVHIKSCRLLPMNEAIDLGLHPNCHSAVRKAKEHYTKVDGCIHCCRECHHG